jgi:lysophospholipase L1-like esterase
MALISRGAPVYSSSDYASSNDAADASDASYDTYWRSAGAPATLAFDLSSVNPSNRTSILLVYYNDLTYSYDHTTLNEPGYNNLGSYTVEVNAAAGGGSPPTSGWVVMATVTNNTFHSKEHVINFNGYNWVRLNVSATDGAPPYNIDIAANVDIYDASAGDTDGWFFVGDSITIGSFDHNTLDTTASFDNLVGALNGDFPAEEEVGEPGFTSTTFGPYFSTWVQAFPGKFVAINLGSNDAAFGVTPSEFYTNMSAFIQEVLSLGKIPVIPTISWASDPARSAQIPLFNQQIQNLYTAFPQVIHGPDAYTYFFNHQDQIDSDGIHPSLPPASPSGAASLRTLWAQTAATLYGP